MKTPVLTNASTIASTTTTMAAASTGNLNVARIPAFEDNYLWVIHDGKYAVAIDPGDATPVIDFLAAHDLQLQAILITHHHPDHIGGIAALVDWCAHRVPIWVTDNEFIKPRTHIAVPGKNVSIASLGLEFHVLSLPGHTADHIAYYLPLQGWLFSGDVIFAGGCGRLLGGTATQMQTSLATIAALPAETLIFCAHEYTLSNLRFAVAIEPGNRQLRARVEFETARRARNEATVPTTVGVERATNPFLRWDSEEVKLAILRASSGKIFPNAAPDIVFAEMRKWKDRF